MRTLKSSHRRVFLYVTTQPAAQLLSAVESALKALNAAAAEQVLHFHAQTLAAVREQLGEQAFQAAWREGAQWSLEEAVKQELKDE